MPALSIMVKPVSGACNMHCRYCFYTDVMSRRQTAIYPRMTLETLEALVRRAFRCADGQISFAFQGGEPTLIGLPFFEALMRFERAYNTRGLAVSNAVQTNGYDMPEELLSFFVQEKFLIGVSLDGDRAAHDLLRLDRDGAPTYDRVRANVERFRRAGAELNILCVVNEYVARRPREVFQALAPCRNLQFIACLDDFDGEKTDYSLTEESYLRFLKITFDLYYEAFCAGRPRQHPQFRQLPRHPPGHSPGELRDERTVRAVFPHRGRRQRLSMRFLRPRCLADGQHTRYFLQSPLPFARVRALPCRIASRAAAMQGLRMVCSLPQRLQAGTRRPKRDKPLVRLLPRVFLLCRPPF